MQNVEELVFHTFWCRVAAENWFKMHELPLLRISVVRKENPEIFNAFDGGFQLQGNVLSQHSAWIHINLLLLMDMQRLL